MLTGEHKLSNARWFRGLVGGEWKQIQFLAESNLVKQRLIKIALPKQPWFVETAFEKKVNILTTSFQIYVKTMIAGRWLCGLKHILLSLSTLIRFQAPIWAASQLSAIPARKDSVPSSRFRGYMHAHTPHKHKHQYT